MAAISYSVKVSSIRPLHLLSKDPYLKIFTFGVLQSIRYQYGGYR